MCKWKVAQLLHRLAWSLDGSMCIYLAHSVPLSMSLDPFSSHLAVGRDSLAEMKTRREQRSPKLKGIKKSPGCVFPYYHLCLDGCPQLVLESTAYMSVLNLQKFPNSKQGDGVNVHSSKVKKQLFSFHPTWYLYSETLWSWRVVEHLPTMLQGPRSHLQHWGKKKKKET
jgi:hypothetical protein